MEGRLKNRIEVLMDLLPHWNRMNLWEYDAVGQMVPGMQARPNHEEVETLFSLDECMGTALNHAKESNKPIALSDAIGLSWMVLPYKEREELQGMYLLGPVWVGEASKQYVEKKLAYYGLHQLRRRQIGDFLLTLPVVNFTSFLSFGPLLYFAVYEEEVDTPEVEIQQVRVPKAEAGMSENITAYEKWASEQKMVRMMKEGALNTNTIEISMSHLKKINIGSLGYTSLRQVQNEIIVAIVLYTRAAIEGGVDVETSYSLSDKYMLEVERCTRVAEVYRVATRMVNDFSMHVKMGKEYTKYSKCVRECMRYVERNLEENIDVEELADKLSYTKYYVTSKFKKETGKSIHEYVKERRVKEAKLYLKTTNMSIAEIGERLRFGSPSFFISTFKTYMGMTPKQFREKEEI